MLGAKNTGKILALPEAGQYAAKALEGDIDMSINQTVNVNSYFFSNNLRAFPREIEFNNTRFTFNDGLQYSVGKGPEAMKLYDMSDGHTTYRLKQFNDSWTLISTQI